MRPQFCLHRAEFTNPCKGIQTLIFAAAVRPRTHGSRMMWCVRARARACLCTRVRGRARAWARLCVCVCVGVRGGAWAWAGAWVRVQRYQYDHIYDWTQLKKQQQRALAGAPVTSQQCLPPPPNHPIVPSRERGCLPRRLGVLACHRPHSSSLCVPPACLACPRVHRLSPGVFSLATDASPPPSTACFAPSHASSPCLPSCVASAGRAQACARLTDIPYIPLQHTSSARARASTPCLPPSCVLKACALLGLTNI